MRAHTPQDQPPDGGRRPSVGGGGASRFRASIGGGLPRPQTSLRESRIGSFRASSNTQPSYNLFTGETATATATGRPPSRQSQRGGGGGGEYPQSQRAMSRESSKENMAPPDAEEYETQRRRIEELKAEVGTLNYRITTHEQEKEMARLQHDSEVRDARRRAEEDFKGKQAAEAERDAAQRQLESLQEQLDELRTEKEGRTRELEKRARDAEEEMRLLRDQLEDLHTTQNEEARINERKRLELQTQIASAQRSALEMGEEGQEKDTVIQKLQAQLLERDTTIGSLEADVLRLKAHTGDAETMAVIRRELTDQVQHIRSLEATNREQFTELKRFRKAHQAVEVVEEEKRSLQRRLDAAMALEDELREARIQRQRLEDERSAWTAYLRSESASAAAGGAEIEFDSPEALARALVQERLNSASMVEKLGSLEPELAQRELQNQQLIAEQTALVREIEQLKSAPPSRAAESAGGAGGAADKGRLRLERQRVLALKEVEYLRAQLKTFDAEDITFHSENFDQAKAEQIKKLEELVDQYKMEVMSLHEQLSSLEPSAVVSPAVPTAAGTKRAREDDDDAAAAAAAHSEQLGQLARKNRKLQEELAALQRAHREAEKDLGVARSQLATARESAKVRVLSLKSNPTSDHEATKASRLRALEQENAELLSHMQSPSNASSKFPTIPLSVLAAAQREIADAQADAASAHKTSRRLKEVWGAKSAEFKEAIFSTLGWTVTFIPNGKMRVESVYHPSLTDEHENSIVFDGERGTMKVGGGPRSAFARRIDDQIRFWVREKGCIPGFLAALTLEFYEEHTRSSKPS